MWSGTCSGMTRLPVIFFLLALLPGLPAGAQIEPVTGKVSLSVDAAGSIEGSHTIEAEKPSASAKVLFAFLFAAGNSSRTIEDGDVTLDDTPVAWVDSVIHGFGNAPDFFHNVRADVTAIVAPVLDAAEPGRVAFDVVESGGTTIDGEVLAVVFDDDEQEVVRTIRLGFGGISGDTRFVLTLLDGIDPQAPGALADFGVGISFSRQTIFDPDVGFVARSVVVDDVVVTSAAGGGDDGGGVPGALITAGGLDDSNANPDDPNALPNGDPRADDELYSLLPFLSPSVRQYRIDSSAVTPTDNFFFSYFVLSDIGVVNAGILLEPDGEVNRVGDEHTVFATVVDDQGEPAAGVGVTFTVREGPNADTTGRATTDADGVAAFTYTGDGGAGVDEIVASFLFGNFSLFSNTVTKQWASTLAVTLAPETASLPVGARHTVTADVTDDAGAPQGDVDVVFEVLRGPNVMGEIPAVTGDDGTATFSYAGLAAGTDEIQASLVDDLGETVTSNLVTAEWLAAILRDPRPALAVSDDDTILVAREEGTGLTEIVTELLDRDGMLLRTELVSDGVSVDRSPAAAYLEGGSFVVVYVRGRPEANALVGRLLGADGLVTGAEVIVDTTNEVCERDPAGECPIAFPAVAALPGGGAVVVWRRDGSIVGSIFDAGGAAVTSFAVAEVALGAPAVAARDDGSFLVAYVALADDEDSIRVARFDAAGSLLGDVAASLFDGGVQDSPAVASAPPDGRAVAAWESFSAATGSGVFGRVDPEDPQRPEVQLNSQIVDDQLGPALAVEPSGLVTAVWLDAFRNVLAAQRLTPGLLFVGGETAFAPSIFLDSTSGAGVFGRPRAASLADGTVVVVTGVAGDDEDPDGAAAVGFVGPTPLARCFDQGRLVCLKQRLVLRQGHRRHASDQ